MSIQGRAEGGGCRCQHSSNVKNGNRNYHFITSSKITPPRQIIVHEPGSFPGILW